MYVIFFPHCSPPPPPPPAPLLIRLWTLLFSQAGKLLAFLWLQIISELWCQDNQHNISNLSNRRKYFAVLNASFFQLYFLSVFSALSSYEWKWRTLAPRMLVRTPNKGTWLHLPSASMYFGNGTEPKDFDETHYQPLKLIIILDTKKR